MPEIGVRELKTYASEIIRSVREEGVRYLVTYRGLSPQAALDHVRAVKPLAMSADGYDKVLMLLEPGKLPDRSKLL